MKNIIDLIKNHKENYLNDSKENKIVNSFSEHISDINLLDNIWIYGIKIGVNDISKTESFIKHFTLEPPFTSYGKNCFSTLDYIFYKGNLNPVRVYDIPDCRKMAMDVGEMPNEIFPSDHLSICVDFLIMDN